MKSLELATEDFTGWIGGCDPSYSCAYMNTISWKNATTPMPMEINPRSVFERMFGRPGTSQQRLARMATDRSVLDSLLEELKGMSKGLGGKDPNRLNDYLENVREIESRIQKAEKQSLTDVEVPDAPVGIPEEFEDHAALMYDLMALAYEADLTRVVTYMKSRDASQRVYPKIGVTEPHHAMSHHGNNSEKLANLVKLNTYHVDLFRSFVEKLAKTPDGDGSLLDHTLILYGSGMSESDTHSRSNIPTLLVGKGAGLVQGQSAHRGAEGNADGEFPARPGEQVRVRRQVVRDQHGPVRSRVMRARGRAMRKVLAAAAVMVLSSTVAFAAGAPVIDAVKSGNVEAVRTLLQKRADVNLAESDGMTALHWAARNNDLASAQTAASRRCQHQGNDSLWRDAARARRAKRQRRGCSTCSSRAGPTPMPRCPRVRRR